jgi:hypothetical protein
MMDVITLLFQMLSGIGGGHIVAQQLKASDLGSAGNTLAGLVGGGLGGQILGNLLGVGGVVFAPDAGGPDLANVMGLALTSAGGGGLLTLLMGWLTRKVQPAA